MCDQKGNCTLVIYVSKSILLSFSTYTANRDVTIHLLSKNAMSLLCPRIVTYVSVSPHWLQLLWVWLWYHLYRIVHRTDWGPRAERADVGGPLAMGGRGVTILSHRIWRRFKFLVTATCLESNCHIRWRIFCGAFTFQASVDNIFFNFEYMSCNPIS